MKRGSSERGLALLVVLFAMLVISAIGGALVLSTISETMIAANGRGARDAFYAADAAVERALADVAVTADWNQILNGSVSSTMVDGVPSGTRQLGSGARVDVGQQVNLANCGKATACTDADMNSTSTARPWGANNPRWQPYAYGPLDDVVPQARSGFYVLVLVADDPAETDGNPFVDAPTTSDAGHGLLVLRGLAFGPRGAHCTVQLTAVRTGPSVRVTNWSWW
jgi:hypothetical protein